jgi:altronate dehydratase
MLDTMNREKMRVGFKNYIFILHIILCILYICREIVER